MHSTTRLQPVGILPYLPPFLAWTIAADGTILSMNGPAEDRFAAEVGRVVGIDYRAAFAGEPQAMRLIERALSGEALAQPTRAWGAQWWNMVAPRYERAALVCVDGCSFPYPDGVEVEEPEPEPRRRTWEIAGLPRAPHETYRDGDFFIKVDGFAGVAMGRRITDAEFLALHMEHGPHLRLTDDSGHACQSRPPLRLVP